MSVANIRGVVNNVPVTSNWSYSSEVMQGLEKQR